MTQSEIDASELRPEVVISVLREKITAAERRVTDVRIDIQVIEGLPDHSPTELAMLQKNLIALRAIRDAYQARLDAIGTVAREQAS